MKLETKSVREEFHGDGGGGNRKLLYEWNTLNANVWLPSLSELIGTDPNYYHDPYGTYYSAMQGVGLSSGYYVDAQGGNQFNYFNQFNQSGGEKLWNACAQEIIWLRSNVYWDTVAAWRITNASNINTIPVTTSHAVHPVIGTSSISLLSTKRHTGDKLYPSTIKFGKGEFFFFLFFFLLSCFSLISQYPPIRKE